MRRIRTLAFAIAALLFLFVLVTADRPVDGQTRGTLDTLQPRLAQRKQVLERQELAREEILDRLEFLPRFRQTRLTFPFFDFCLLPFPTPAGAIDPHRSLFVHDRPTLDAKDFSLRRTLGQIATQVAPTVPGT
ncbi:MAG: hypothetical protein ICV68_05110, partial [Pyrinomonadaceae bacterium]|nr:hypothetical protein [Pyrinomonadaceae bacterium]